MASTSEVYISKSADAPISSSEVDSLHMKKVTFWTMPSSPPGLEKDTSKPMYVPLEEDVAWCRSTASGSSPDSSEEEAEGEKQDTINDEDLDISHLLAGMASLIGNDDEHEVPSEDTAVATEADLKAIEEHWSWGTPAYMRPKNFCAWCGVPRMISHSFCPQCGVAFAYLD
ncbi:unnamed protein product [Cladocopium goreaui]|uniref:Uncharacterized protein n=1 Tax=Cladocopium goreaui TaxID=2562237 RepID=A0A9P1CE11_9DINO|nr:unnamed protein product [Cladocopium goreaui]